MMSKVPVIGPAIELKRVLKQEIPEIITLLRNGGGEKLRKALEERKANG